LWDVFVLRWVFRWVVVAVLLQPQRLLVEAAEPAGPSAVVVVVVTAAAPAVAVAVLVAAAAPAAAADAAAPAAWIQRQSLQQFVDVSRDAVGGVAVVPLLMAPVRHSGPLMMHHSKLLLLLLQLLLLQRSCCHPANMWMI
jgi:hypothetical protein